MKTRIVITGWGCLTSAGHCVDETWNTIKQGKSNIGPIKAWDTNDWEYSLGAEIQDFDARKLISDRKLLKMLSRHDVIGLNSVEQAVKHSQLLPYRDSLADPTEFNESMGVYVASPGSKFHQQYDFFPLLTHAQGNLQRFGSELNSIVNPMWLLRTLPNNVLAYTGIQYGFKGANQNIINHSVGGTQAILEATYALQRGTIKRAVVVGYDAMIEPQTQTYYAALGVVSKNGIKPFDEHRDGTLLAEGSGTLILETLEAATERGATIYGEILGGATSTEAIGIFPIQENGSGLLQVIQDTLQRTHLTAESVGMITAHANGTVMSDAVEANVIASLFAKNANLPVTGFKWTLGHTFAAAGVIETIMTLKSLSEETAPGIGSMQQKANDCSAISVSQAHQKIQKPIALVVNRGFASISTCLAVTGT